MWWGVGELALRNQARGLIIVLRQSSATGWVKYTETMLQLKYVNYYNHVDQMVQVDAFIYTRSLKRVKYAKMYIVQNIVVIIKRKISQILFEKIYQ